MLKFINKEYDILVSTTIIESGLDIRNANTMFIHDADMFGLADLHQLRGRVGRHKNRAYCYLLLPRDRPVTQQSHRRLKAIEDYSELGAGFRIAMRDLEIRGAGNILGPEQAGHIAGVGYEMYCQLMEEAVRKLRNAPEPKRHDCKVDLGVDMFLPKGWIEADRARMEAYRRITRCQTLGELDSLGKELSDRFGPMPAAAKTVFELNELRVMAAGWGIASMQLHKPDVIFGVRDMSVIGPLFAKATGVVRIAGPDAVHLRMPANYLEPQTLMPVLRKLLAGGK
jgi:transcription-repair coupling factor (superfamily II helicase)